MFPINTRPVIRSKSPPPRSRGLDGENPREERTAPSNDDATAVSASVSIRTAIREYELVHDELAALNERRQRLISKMSALREDVQKFMQDRKLEKLGTRDGRIAIRMTTKTACSRPGKRETVRCVDETIGDEHPELAQKLIHKLFEENRRSRTHTRFDKRTTDENP